MATRTIVLAPSAYYPSLGGVEELTRQMAVELEARGWRVVVVVHRALGDRSLETTEGIPVLRVYIGNPGRRPSRTWSFFSSVRHLDRRLDAELSRPDLVHIICPSNQTFPITRWASRRSIPVVLTTQGETVMDAGQAYQRDAYARWSLRYATRRAAALTACSDFARQHAAVYAPSFSESKVVLNGVSSGAADISSAVSEEPVLAAYGRHVPQKGFDLLLRAFEDVRAARPDARLLLGGAGTETEALQALAGEGVTFLGPLDRGGVRDLLSQARTVVVPSRIEPFGIVALEALAAGRLLVYANTTGLPEAAGPCGWGVDPEDTAALAAAILETFDVDPTEQVALGRARAAELSWENIVDQYEAVYARAGVTRG